VDEAYQLLDEMIEKGAKPDIWSYNTILAYHCEHSEVTKSLRLISRIHEDSCQADRHTYNMVLKLLIRVGRFDRVTKVWESMEDTSFHPSVSTYAVMVHGLCKKKGKLEEACRYFEMMIDDGIPPYSSTCELLRNRLIGLGFSEETDILADKMQRSTSCSIQELANVVRGNKSAIRIRGEDHDYSDDSDDSVVEDWRRSN
jgi:pentatricopeptide repeat protein